jgi:hypothetical protein
MDVQKTRPPLPLALDIEVFYKAMSAEKQATAGGSVREVVDPRQGSD